jgi:hypothetical protein
MIFRPKREGVTREWRRLHNEELNNLYSSSNIVRVIKSRRMRWSGHVASMWEIKGVNSVLVGKPEEKTNWKTQACEDNINMNLLEVGCDCMELIELSRDRDSWRALVNVVMNLRVS